jgi:uncharacterized protein
MSARANELVRTLDLKAHPEGGYYREVFRSPASVRPEDARPPRNALTVIYFLLEGSGCSRWHRVLSDETWHWAEGAPLELFQADAAMSTCVREVLGPLGGGAEPLRVVPAGHWQAARSTGAYTLVTCTVGPGFDFADFQLLADSGPDAALLRRRFPDVEAMV